MGYFITKNKLYLLQNIIIKLILLKFPARFCALAERLSVSKIRNKTKAKEVSRCLTISFRMNIVIPSYFLIHFIGKRDFQVCLMRLVQASLNILVHDVINLLYYEHLKDKQNAHLTLIIFKLSIHFRSGSSQWLIEFAY